MKKISILFGVLFISSLSCFAYLDESTTSEIDTLRAQGYSESMLQIADFVNEKNKGINGNYERRFKPVRYSGKMGAYSKMKIYFDPTQDDGKFGEHQINFTNTWMGEPNWYSSQLKEHEVVENL